MAGRPSIYSDEISVEICRRLAGGESLRAICRDDVMPAEGTVRGWAIDDREGFSAHYARARDIGLDCKADEVMEIAFSDSEDVQRDRLKFDAVRWYLSKLAPKRYGEAQHHEPVFVPIETRDVNMIDLARRIAWVLTQAAEAKQIEGQAEAVE